MKKHIAFLRGINVGGHHKILMVDLRQTLEDLGFENVVTLLNSGNAIFDAASENSEALESMISEKLEKTFGFPVPTIVRSSEMITQLFHEAPFHDVEVTNNTRLYVSFLKTDVQSGLQLPWKSPDSSFKIIEKKNKTILSILDLSVSGSPQAMEILEKSFGKDITTRNWKTIERIANKL